MNPKKLGRGYLPHEHPPLTNSHETKRKSKKRKKVYVPSWKPKPPYRHCYLGRNILLALLRWSTQRRGNENTSPSHHLSGQSSQPCTNNWKMCALGSNTKNKSPQASHRRKRPPPAWSVTRCKLEAPRPPNQTWNIKFNENMNPRGDGENAKFVHLDHRFQSHTNTYPYLLRLLRKGRFLSWTYGVSKDIYSA